MENLTGSAEVCSQQTIRSIRSIRDNDNQMLWSSPWRQFTSSVKTIMWSGVINQAGSTCVRCKGLRGSDEIRFRHDTEKHLKLRLENNRNHLRRVFIKQAKTHRVLQEHDSAGLLWSNNCLTPNMDPRCCCQSWRIQGGPGVLVKTWGQLCVFGLSGLLPLTCSWSRGPGSYHSHLGPPASCRWSISLRRRWSGEKINMFTERTFDLMLLDRNMKFNGDDGSEFWTILTEV